MLEGESNHQRHLFVAGAVFGEVSSWPVACRGRAAFDETLEDSGGAKCCIILYKLRRQNGTPDYPPIIRIFLESFLLPEGSPGRVFQSIPELKISWQLQ